MNSLTKLRDTKKAVDFEVNYLTHSFNRLNVYVNTRQQENLPVDFDLIERQKNLYIKEAIAKLEKLI